MVTTTTEQGTTTGRKFVWFERLEHPDGEQVVLGEILDGGEATSYRVGFTNEDPSLGPVVHWSKGGEPLYWVTCSPEGVAEQCSCPDFRLNRRRKSPCKHVRITTGLIRARAFVL